MSKQRTSSFSMPGIVKFIKNAVKSDKQKSPTLQMPTQKTIPIDGMVGGEKSIVVYERSNFLIGHSIGQGSFAMVYKGKERLTGREVAMKIVRSQDQIEFDDGSGGCPDDAYRDVLDAMRIEANIIAGIGAHPNIVQLLGVTADFTVLIMERGLIDIYCLLKKQPTVALPVARLWIKHVLTAVDHLHDLRIIHQDIKSSNVIIFADRTAKLCDFGLARDAEGDMPVDRELVTLWYRPPELLMGATHYTERVDEWGVGCVALELLLGASPFKGKPGHECTCPEVSHYNFNSDQLTKIFNMLGTPPEGDKSYLLACAPHFTPWPRHPRQLEAKIVDACQRRLRLMEADPFVAAAGIPGEDAVADGSLDAAQWAELVSGLLTFSPDNRLTARQALNLSVFSSLRPARRLAFSMSEGHLLPDGAEAIGANANTRAARRLGNAGAGMSRSGAAPLPVPNEARALDAILEACRTQSSRALLPTRPASAVVAEPRTEVVDATAHRPATAGTAPSSSGGRRPPQLQQVEELAVLEFEPDTKPIAPQAKPGPAVLAPPTPSKLGPGGLAVGDAPDVFFL